MTLISVGSTSTAGNTKGARGTTPGDGAAPSGFEELLAGAESAHESDRETVRDTAPRRDEPCDGPTSAEATDAAVATDATAAGEGAGAGPEKPDAPVDPFGLVAAQAVPIPTTPVTPVVVTDTTATGTDATPVTDVTPVLPDPTVLVDGEGDTPPPTPATVDLTEILATLTPDDAAPDPDPVPLPLPDLPVTPARTPHTDAAAVTRETFAPTATTAERARPAPSPLPAPTGAATFAPPPPPPTTAAMANVNLEENVAAAGRTAPPPPSEQLVSVLTPLRTTQNGTYTLRLELKPPELGRVEMRVEMRDGVLHASIHAEQHNSAQVLRDALTDLRDRLGAGGVRAGELTVSDGSVGSRQQSSGPSPEARASHADAPMNDDTVAADTPALVPTLDSEATSLLDVRV